MTDKLPGEILEKISIDLSPNDLCAAVRVCRSWNVAFIPTLYGVVDIRTLHKFKLFVATLRDSENLNAFGHTIRILKLSFQFNLIGDLDLDWKRFWKKYNIEFKLLLRLCPFVAELDSLDDWCPEAMENFQVWKHLTKLPRMVCSNPLPTSSLDFFRNRLTRLTIACADSSEWKDLVTELPCIESLTLTPIDICSSDETKNTLSISVLDLEIVHKALRFLRSLTVELFYLHGEIPNDITPCGTVHELVLESKSGYLWDQYVARKYTALETLKISSSNPYDEINEAGLITLVKSCRHLKWFEQTRCSDYGVGTNRQLLDTLYEMGTPVANLHVKDWDVLSYTTVISHFYRTLSSIHFHYMQINDFLDPLKQCPSLVNFNLSGAPHDVYIDCILDHCKYLKYLSIDSSPVRVSKDYNSGSQHGLRRLFLSNGDVSDEIFAYISQRCPDITYISYYYGNCARSSTIYITNPSLERFDFGYYEQSYVYKLTRLDKPKRIRSKSRRYHESTGTYQVKYWTRWYHHCTDEGKTFRRLNASEIVKLSDQPRKNDSRYHTNELQKDSGDQIASDNIHDIPIISIYCGSVDEIRLGEARII